MSTHVIALFEQRADAERAVEDLIAKNIPRDKISVIAHSDSEHLKEVETPTAMAAEGAAAGLTTGAVVGGVLGLLAGAGIGFVPAGLAIAGPLSGLLAGGAAGAATGGILGGLVGLGVPSNLANTLEEGIKRGGALITVEARDEDIDLVEETLDRDGATAINERSTHPEEESPLAQEPAQMRRERARVARYVRQDPPQKEAEIPDGRREVNAEDQFEPYQEIFRADFSAKNLSDQSFEEHEPAYRFGFEAAKKDQFDGHDWSSAEAQLRDEWEAQRPGTWEQYRGAIMAGWNRCHASITNGGAEVL
jgi:uncharacterized membrane protein